MKFSPAEDSGQDLICRKISESGLIEIGVHHVMFGHRIRVGYAGRQYCELDYCAGANQEDVERLYAVIETVLSNQDEKTIDWDIFPKQNIKPVFNDSACWSALIKLAGDISEIQKLPNLQALKNKMFEDLGLLLM